MKKLRLLARAHANAPCCFDGRFPCLEKCNHVIKSRGILMSRNVPWAYQQ